MEISNLIGFSAMIFFHSYGGGGILSGFLHPLLGLDHLLAMLAVGILSAQIGGRALWSVPATRAGTSTIQSSCDPFLLGGSGRSVNAADLVPIRIQEVAEVHHTHGTFAGAGRVLNARATVGYGHIVELPELLRGIADESDRRTVGGGVWLTVDRLAHAERRAVMHVEQPGLTGVVHMLHGRVRTEHTENGIVKTLGSLDVVRADHHVIEHLCIPSND